MERCTRRVARAVPAAGRAPQPGGPHAVRRRAADAGPRRRFAARPRLLLLDEPSLGLAPKIVDEVFAAIRRFMAERIAVVLVEQYVERALEVADDVTVLRHGEVAWAGASAAVDLEALAEGYLGAG